MEDHKYQKRIIKELEQCRNKYSDVVHEITVLNTNSTYWVVTLTNDIRFELFITSDFPFESPSVKFLNVDDPNGNIKSQCEESWYAGSRICDFIYCIIINVQKIIYKKEETSKHKSS